MASAQHARLVRGLRNTEALADAKLGGPSGMPISARKHGTRLPGERAWHAGPPGGVAGSRGRRSGRTHATYLARPGRRRSRQARRGRSSACQLRGYSLSVHRAAAKPRGPVSSEHAPARGAGTRCRRAQQDPGGVAWPASSAPLIWLEGAPRKVRGRSCGKLAAGIGAGASGFGGPGPTGGLGEG